MSVAPHGKLKVNARMTRRDRLKPENVNIGVVGLGLMGRSITTCLLSAGHSVNGVDIDVAKRRRARSQVLEYLRQMRSKNLLETEPEKLICRLSVSRDYSSLEKCHLVIECVTEDDLLKRQVLKKVEGAVSPTALIATNTSAIPISGLQRKATHPERIIGLHWAEPAHLTRFMEVICGDQTGKVHARWLLEVARDWWGKQPSLVRRDVRGFITNRISYAMFREAFHLVESGIATVEDIDRSLRNDVGYWITFAGPFRYMDLMGLHAYGEVMRGLFPELCCEKQVPRLMQRMLRSGARGVENCKGFYRYSPRQAKRWSRLFLRFNYEIRQLADKYPGDVEIRA